MPEAKYTQDDLRHIAQADVDYIWPKDQSYGQSWMKRGGVGAFMMLARKWDRLEQFMKKCSQKYDIFKSIEENGGFSGDDGSTLAEIRDLRRYLLLVEAHMTAEAGMKPIGGPRTEKFADGRVGPGPGEDRDLDAVPAQQRDAFVCVFVNGCRRPIEENGVTACRWPIEENGVTACRLASKCLEAKGEMLHR